MKWNFLALTSILVAMAGVFFFPVTATESATACPSWICKIHGGGAGEGTVQGYYNGHCYMGGSYGCEECCDDCLNEPETDKIVGPSACWCTVAGDKAFCPV